ncbi:TetR/AcrR family transcriptional regulator [Nocardioides currus]|uniref:TetR/AcrR family transcriptional regulator n=1 Tax=Nocardioides currus TaxID=2133958 RepID=UPI001A9CA65E|nr:TetR family transcriptional regulator [Nocardioides currus]
MPEPAPRPTTPPARVSSKASSKAEQTRATIVSSALDLFRTKGFEGTTMRGIADAAGVSLGSAYYYFAGKEHLIQAFYGQMQGEHLTAARSVLDRETDFSARLRGVLEAWVETAEPYHEFAGTFFKNAAEPTSPLSPFSPESTDARDASIAIYAEVVTGSDIKVASALRPRLPELLWLLQMGIVLFWVHDRSDDQARTRALIGGVVPLVDKLARLSRVPVVRGVTADLVALLDSLRS